MPKTPPTRFKTPEEFTVADHFAAQVRGGGSGATSGVRPETDAYKKYVADVHRDAGLDVPDSAAETRAAEDMTPAELTASMMRPPKW